MDYAHKYCYVLHIYFFIFLLFYIDLTNQRCKVDTRQYYDEHHHLDRLVTILARHR